jgi:predicted DNA-binding helix-hairpin-helix protein
MARLVEVARVLRQRHHFLGYVHLKVVPEADPRWWTRRALGGPRERERGARPAADLDALAPGRRLVSCTRAMDRLRDGIAEAHEARYRLHAAPHERPAGRRRAGAAPRCRASPRPAR